LRDGLYSFAPFGACSTFPHYTQRLAPWAAFLSLLRSLGLFRDRVLVYVHSRPDSQFGLLLLLLFCCCDVGHGLCIHSIMKIGVRSRLSARDQRCLREVRTL
jgi:hypothetical protein